MTSRIWLLHAGKGFDLAGVGESFGCGIVSAFGEHDARAHVIDPAANEFLFHIVVSVDSMPFERHLLFLTIRSGHFHFPGHVER